MGPRDLLLKNACPRPPPEAPLAVMGPVVVGVYGLAVLLLVFWSSLWIVHIMALFYG